MDGNIASSARNYTETVPSILENSMYIMLFVSIAAFCLYFLPTIISNSRMTNGENLLCILNILLGWTVIGWVALLIWAIADGTERNKRHLEHLRIEAERKLNPKKSWRLFD